MIFDFNKMNRGEKIAFIILSIIVAILIGVIISLRNIWFGGIYNVDSLSIVAFWCTAFIFITSCLVNMYDSFKSRLNNEKYLSEIDIIKKENLENKYILEKLEKQNNQLLEKIEEINIKFSKASENLEISQESAKK